MTLRNAARLHFARRLTTLRIDPPGGGARMRLNHIAAARLAAACSTVQSLCIGFRPAPRPAPAPVVTPPAGKPRAPVAQEPPFFDMALVASAMPRRLQTLEVYSAALVTWPTARAWPAALLVHTLVLDVPVDWCVRRAPLRIAWPATSIRLCALTDY